MVYCRSEFQLESSCPVVAQCFSSTQQVLSTAQSSVRTVTDHAKFLLTMLDKIMDNEQDIEEIREIGARHCILKQKYGLGTVELDKFQEIFVDVILKQDGVRNSKEASRAWRILICSIVDVFRDGFEAQLRQFRRKHSFNAHTQYFENIERRVSNASLRKSSLNADSQVNHCTRRMSQLDLK
ncbi:hypothetical protein DICVIV_07030 [Dictyocaulus viviparus]|uniref:Globin n=1 Tax=Dictyocaulus viviparus TaxID=29172 RepID=A0A0D8XT22_DICVI|nr:hypothetical protein DICVIV_07030 [Dictyocaulus viviparus]